MFLNYIQKYEIDLKLWNSLFCKAVPKDGFSYS